MNLFRRISATFSASMEDVVSRVEDHDAVVEAAIRDGRKAAAKIKVRLARVQKDGAQLEKRKQELKQQLSKWTERARKEAAVNEERAIVCIKKKKETEEKLVDINRAISGHKQVEAKLSKDFEGIQTRLADTQQRRNTMRSRQFVSEANRILEKLEGDDYSGVDEIFDRWEEQILESEVIESVGTVPDFLETEYILQEERADLELELEKIKSEGVSKS